MQACHWGYSERQASSSCLWASHCLSWGLSFPICKTELLSTLFNTHTPLAGSFRLILKLRFPKPIIFSNLSYTPPSNHTGYPITFNTFCKSGAGLGVEGSGPEGELQQMLRWKKLTWPDHCPVCTSKFSSSLYSWCPCVPPVPALFKAIPSLRPWGQQVPYLEGFPPTLSPCCLSLILQGQGHHFRESPPDLRYVLTSFYFCLYLEIMSVFLRSLTVLGT